MSGFVLALCVEVRFPATNSLKQKRSCLRPIIEGIKAKFTVAVAETGHQDSWQRCALTVAIAASDPAHGESVAQAIEDFVWAAADTEVLEIRRYWMELD